MPETRVDFQCPCSFVRVLVHAADRMTQAAKVQVPIEHPDDADLAFLYATTPTDGRDAYDEAPGAFVPSNLRGPATQA